LVDSSPCNVVNRRRNLSFRNMAETYVAYNTHIGAVSR